MFKKFGGPLVPVCQLCPESPRGNGQAGYGCPCDRDSDCAASGQAGPTSLDFSGPTRAARLLRQQHRAELGRRTGRVSAADGSGGNDITSAMLYGNNAVEEFERTRWLCKANCNALEERTNLDYACLYDQQPGIDFFNAACVDTGSCAGLMRGSVRGDGHALRPDARARAVRRGVHTE